MNQVFAALSDPTRREILSMLSRGDLTAGEVAQAFDMTKPSISHHLSVLRNANLVESKRVGQTIVYSINTSVLEDTLAGFLRLTRRDGSRKARRKE